MLHTLDSSPPASRPRGALSHRLRLGAFLASGVTVASMLLVPATGASAAGPTVYSPVLVDGQAQATLAGKPVTKKEIWIKTSVDTDRDGTPDELHAVLSLPSVATGGVTVPTVIEASPYYGGVKAVPQHDPHRELWDPSMPKPAPVPGNWMRPGDRDSPYSTPRGAYWLSRGFAHLAVSTVGTGNSTGCPQMLSREEAEANKAVIQWLTGEGGVTARDANGTAVTATDWSSGKAAMTGTSYDGALPLLTATTGVKGLEAIAPMAPVSSFYDYYHVGGGMYGPEGYQGEDLDNYVSALLTDAGDRARCAATEKEFLEKQDRASGDYNDFWDERNLLKFTGNVRAATLIGHGQADLNVRVGQSTDWYQAMRENGVPTKLFLHQQAHVNVGGVSGSKWTETLNRWFTHYLFGVDNGAQNDTGARIQTEDGTWIDDPAFPHPGAETVNYFPTANGSQIGQLEPETRTGSVESISFADDSAISLQKLVESSTSPNRLLYSSAPLASELRLSGTATATLGIALNRPAGNITMAIVDRDPTGETTIISRAWTDPQNRTDNRTTEAVVPGTSYDLTLSFVPTDYRIKAGHSIGLLIASSDTATSLLPPTTTQLTVDTSVTAISLPVVGGAVSSRAAFGAPGAPAVVAVSPSVTVGDAQSVTGSGLAPNVDLQVTAGGAAPFAVRTDANGGFSATLPKAATDTVGDKTVTLTAGRAPIASAVFQVTPAPVPPTVELSTDQVYPGDPFTVELSGFAPNSEVTVELQSNVVVVGTVATNADGTASLDVTTPDSAEPGAHHIVATDAAGTRAEAPLTVLQRASVTAAAPHAIKPGGLASTGGEGGPWFAAGISLLVAGAGAVLFGILRRRRSEREGSAPRETLVTTNSVDGV